MKKIINLLLFLFIEISIFGQTWIPSQTSWLNNSYNNTIIDPVNLLDNNAATNGYLSMSVYSIVYTKELYIDFGSPKNIDGFKVTYIFPNTLRNACNYYPGDITNTCKGNLYYKNQSNQWIAAYTIIPDNPPGHNNSGGLNTIDFSMACPMTDSITFIFSGITAREWKFEMIGNYWLGGNFQTTTYFNVKDIYFREFVNATIQVTSPNGNEMWKVGDSHQITWISNDIENVNIHYSFDNGITWFTIANNVLASTKSYNWIIPDTPSEQCLVKVTSTTDDNIFDVSDVVFTIYKDPIPPTPKIIVTSPNGTERWKVNDTHQITWTSNDVTDVNIEYSIDNGINWIFINTVPSIGTYTWTIPNTPSELCLVKITNTIDVTIFDQSDNVFTIYDSIPNPPPIEISIEIPNTFTPNDDGYNDTFGPITTGIISLEMTINDRNGRLIHKIDTIDGKWDGNMPSGIEAPQGVYYYQLTALGYDSFHTREGNVNLYRELINMTPNPVKTTSMVNLKGKLSIEKIISIHNISGQQIKIWNTTDEIVNLDLTFLKSGIYILKASDSEQTIIIKFIKE